MRFSMLLCQSVAYLSVVTASSICRPDLIPASIPYALRQVYQFPNGTWVENIAVRSNGNLLVTLFSAPSLYEIDPSGPAHQEPKANLVHHFDRFKSVTGITEIHPDVFAVVVDNSIWTVKYGKNDKVTVSEVSVIPKANLLNGMATLNEAGIVLVVDSGLGLIWRVDTISGSYTVVLQDATMTPDNSVGFLLGVNGLKILDNYAYYTNTPLQLYCRVAINHNTGLATGPYEIIARGVPADDFAITDQRVAYMAGQSANVVTKVLLDGSKRVIAGNLNLSAVAGASSTAFGRTKKDSDVLYVVTSGASLFPVNGTYSEGGKVVAIQL